MKTRLGVTIAALTLAGGAMFAVAAPGMGGCEGDGRGAAGKHGGMHGGMLGGMQGGMDAKGQHNPEKMLNRLEQTLSLSEQQRQQLGELMWDRAEQMPEQQALMQKLRTQMQRLNPAAADYQDQVAVLAKQRAEQMSQQMVEGARHHAEMYALLTPEQQQALRKMQQHRGGDQGRHPRP